MASNSTPAPAAAKVRVAVAQLCGTPDMDKNYEVVKRFCAEAKEKGAQLLCLPENFSRMGGDEEGRAADPSAPPRAAFSEALDGPLLRRYRDLAAQHRLWLSLGGFPETSPDPARPYNAHVLVDDAGAVVASYRKIHLFDCPLTDLFESKKRTPGSELVLADSPAGRLGLSVCYDLRFPALYAALRRAGAHVVLVPSAFTRKTGEAHWETLLRARAIENQVYVIAAAQGGRHSATRESWGHAMVVDPWGRVLVDLQGEGVATADIDFDALAQLRASMPVMEHARPDAYTSAPRIHAAGLAPRL
eukprot:tig00001471_g8875.t1